MSQPSNDPVEIVRALREKYLDKFRDATQKDDQGEMYALYRVLDALTEAYWCVFHMELPK